MTTKYLGKFIRVSEDTHQELSILKAVVKLKSIDDLIRLLIDEYKIKKEGECR